MSISAPICSRTGVVFYEMLAGKLPFQGQVVRRGRRRHPAPAAAGAGAPELRHHPRGGRDRPQGAREEPGRALPDRARSVLRDLQRVQVGCSTKWSGTARRSAAARAATCTRRPPPPENSIAVITFANITREPADEWIGSGIAETVSADLKNVQGLTVIGRERVFDALRNLEHRRAAATTIGFAIEIGRGLGARWIVSGAFQRLGESDPHHRAVRRGGDGRRAPQRQDRRPAERDLRACRTASSSS